MWINCRILCKASAPPITSDTRVYYLNKIDNVGDGDGYGLEVPKSLLVLSLSSNSNGGESLTH